MPVGCINHFVALHELNVEVTVLTFIGKNNEHLQNLAHEFVQNANRRIHRRDHRLGENFLKLKIVYQKTGAGGKAEWLVANHAWGMIDDNFKILKECNDRGL